MSAASTDKSAYRVNYALFSGNAEIAQAIEAGAIDLGLVGEIPPIFLARRGSRLRIIAVQEADVHHQVLLVPGHSQIGEPKQLRGKRVGYVRASSSHYLLLRLLDRAGLKWANVTPIALSPQDGAAAFGNGELDAWSIFGPFGFAARAHGARTLANAVGLLSGNVPLWRQCPSPRRATACPCNAGLS